MKLTTATPVIYFLTAGTCAAFLVLQVHHLTVPWFLFELLPFGPALLFAYAYPRYVFDAESGKRRRISVIVLNSVSLVAILIVFDRLLTYSSFPVAYFSSAPFLIIAAPIFTISSIFILAKKKSGLAPVAAVLEWTFALAVSASLFTSRSPVGYEPSGLGDVLCSLSPPLLVFAAGSIRHRRAFAHTMALLAVAMMVPRVYSPEFTDFRMESNAWITFNSANFHPMSELTGLSAGITILTVTLLVLAAVVALCRLLPQRWVVRESRVHEWTWPAFVVMVLFLGVWFRLSVLPYRIPLIVDYSDFPIIEILHIEKHGLQFHETCISVYDRRSLVYITHDDRRLFHYRFQEMGYTYGPPAPLMQRVNELVHSPTLARPSKNSLTVPVWSWNADGWYLYVQARGFSSYTTNKGNAPLPSDMVALFHDMEALQGRSGLEENIRDVCLGFCYDPYAAMGWRNAGDRCHNPNGYFVCH